MDDHCPQPPDSGCNCPQHAQGLRAHARDPEAYDRALERLRPAKLRVVTFPPTVDDTVCTGTGGYGCPCPACARERAQRVNTPPRRIRQPWDVEAA